MVDKVQSSFDYDRYFSIMTADLIAVSVKDNPCGLDFAGNQPAIWMETEKIITTICWTKTTMDPTGTRINFTFVKIAHLLIIS